MKIFSETGTFSYLFFKLGHKSTNMVPIEVSPDQSKIHGLPSKFMSHVKQFLGVIGSGQTVWWLMHHNSKFFVSLSTIIMVEFEGVIVRKPIVHYYHPISWFYMFGFFCTNSKQPSYTTKQKHYRYSRHTLQNINFRHITKYQFQTHYKISIPDTIQNNNLKNATIHNNFNWMRK